MKAEEGNFLISISLKTYKMGFRLELGRRRMGGETSYSDYN